MKNLKILIKNIIENKIILNIHFNINILKYIIIKIYYLWG